MAAFSFGVMIMWLPMTSVISQYDLPFLSELVISISLSILTVTGQWILISLFVLINNSCYTPERGVVNGIGQSFASFARFLGPYSGGTMFAWSENNKFWPLNYHFVFLFIGIISIFNGIISYTLPNSIQKSKKQETSEQNNEENNEVESMELINFKQSTVYTIVKSNDDDDNDNIKDNIDGEQKNTV